MRFLIYELLVFFTAILEIYCYQQCTYGVYYFFCNVGICCKKHGTWYCKPSFSTYSNWNCDAFEEAATRTTRTTPTVATTKAPASDKVVMTVFGVVASMTVLICSFTILVRKLQKSRRVPTTETQSDNLSPRNNTIYYTTGVNHINSPRYNTPQSDTPLSTTQTNSPGIYDSPPPSYDSPAPLYDSPPPSYDSIMGNTIVNVKNDYPG